MEEREINKIVVHCSDSGFGDRDAIDRWHKERGWDGIGYNYVILNGVRKSGDDFNPDDDGIVETGRPINIVPAHVKGHNKVSIGVCLIGRHHFTKKQFAKLHKLLIGIIHKHGVLVDLVQGHKELDDSKTCPNFDMQIVREEIFRDFALARFLVASPN